MSSRGDYPSKKSLCKNINGTNVHLGITWSILHGKGWYCRVDRPPTHYDWFWNYEPDRFGFGFHPTNKFTAVREAIRHLNNGGI